MENDSGAVSPGNSTGILTIDGNYTQGATGTLAMEIGGLTAGEQHDKLVVTGAANLDGTLEVLLGFTPATDDSFDILDAAWVSSTGVGALNPIAIIPVGGVPEPGTLALFATVLGAVQFVRQRRRKRS